jgi:phosphoribosyl-ATP pyrophosphohydrolase/phosphoribosyl-AMP cyclohydrolase
VIVRELTGHELTGHELAWDKGQGLLPAIVQHADSGTVLMTGCVNREALALMLERREVVLYSRSRGRLWLKGETSGHRIAVERVVHDCDQDALLVLGRPNGPVCHTGAAACFPDAEPAAASLAFLTELERIVAARLVAPRSGSYTAALMAGGVRRIGQKVGEEAIEVALAAGGAREELVSEAADLLFHLMVLLKARGLELSDVARALRVRHEERRGEEEAVSRTVCEAARQPAGSGSR